MASSTSTNSWVEAIEIAYVTSWARREEEITGFKMETTSTFSCRFAHRQRCARRQREERRPARRYDKACRDVEAGSRCLEGVRED